MEASEEPTGRFSETRDQEPDSQEAQRGQSQGSVTHRQSPGGSVFPPAPAPAQPGAVDAPQVDRRAGRTPHVLSVTEGTARASAGSVIPESAADRPEDRRQQTTPAQALEARSANRTPTGRRPDPSAETDTRVGDTFSTSP